MHEDVYQKMPNVVFPFKVATGLGFHHILVKRIVDQIMGHHLNRMRNVVSIKVVRIKGMDGLMMGMGIVVILVVSNEHYPVSPGPVTLS